MTLSPLNSFSNHRYGRYAIPIVSIVGLIHPPSIGHLQALP